MFPSRSVDGFSAKLETTRADLEPEQDVGFFIADVYVRETGERR